jgi:hypothetical protein
MKLALEMLRDVRSAPVLAFVLNAADHNTANYGYYNYGYGKTV